MVLLAANNNSKTQFVLIRKFIVSIIIMALLLTSRSAAAFVGRGALPRQILGTSRSANNLQIKIVRHASVTGSIYQADDSSNGNKLQVTLFTKEGCTLCDKVKDVLQEFREEIPHSLDQVDITDEAHAEWHAKYKYDIPVLHLNGQYWLKHRTTNDEVRAGLLEALAGRLEARTGEPNAEAMERN